MDVQLCGSGEIVVCHDERLSRLAGVDWEVSHTPLWKLKRADVGSRLGFAPQRIPLLEEALLAMPAHFVINVEIKNQAMEDRGLSCRVGELICQLALEDRAIVSSFNPFCLWRLAASYPTVRRGLLIDPERSFLLQSEVLAPLVIPHSIHPFHEACTGERLASWGDRGWRVAAWTVDDVGRAKELRSSGVAYCITNRPGLLAAELRKGAD